MRTRKILSATAVLLAVGLSCGLVPTGPAAAQAVSSAAPASERTVTAQVAYECQGEGDGLPSGTDNYSVQIQLGVPTSVAPGETVSLRGTLKIQFPEEMRQTAQAIGIDTVDAYSSTISTFRTMGGQSAHYFADRWQSGPTPVRNPAEVSGPLTFPSFEVPENASGELKLQMPQNGATANITTNNPAKVAFTLYAELSGPGGTFNANSSCYLARANPAVIATVPVSSGTPPPGQGPTTTPDTNSPTSDPTSGPAPTDPAAPDAGTGPSTPGADPGVLPVDPGAVPPGTSETPTSSGIAPGTEAYAPSAASGGGVYLSTGVLVLGGFAIILATIGYAALTNFRIRSIRRAMDN